MATSPDYVRLATSSSRTLAETVLESLRDAVIVVDGRRQHLPVVLANAAARGCLADADAVPLIDSPLVRLLAPGSLSDLQDTLTLPSDSLASTRQVLEWRLAGGGFPIATDVRLVAPAAGRLIMLTFAPAVADPGLVEAIDTFPFNLLILDKDLKVTYANAGAVRSGAQVSGAVLGVSALRLTPTAALHPDVYARAFQGRRFHDDAVEIGSAQGPSRWFEVDVQPLKGASGVVRLAVLSIEVTERRLRKYSQSSDDRRLLALTEHARDIIVIADPVGKLLYVRGGVRNSLGYRAEEREGNLLFDRVHPDDYGALRAKYQQLVDGVIPSFSIEYRVRHKDGSYRWFESSYTAALDNPLIGGVVVNSRDVTERKLADGRLAQREEVFRLAADAVNGVIFEIDVERGYVERSQGVLAVLGIEPHELEPTASAWTDRIHPRDFELARKAVNLGLLSGRGWTTTYRIRDVRGRYRSILERGLVQRNANGDPVRAIGCCVDVSEIKRVTDLLAEAQRTAKMGGWEYSYPTREMTWTEEMYRIYEADPHRFAVSWHSMRAQWTPESLQLFNDACMRAEVEDGSFDLELELTTLKNHRIWVRLIGQVELLDGRPFRAFGSVQNVQAQKLAQIALENRTDWLRLSMHMAHMHAWRWDRVGDVVELARIDGESASLPNLISDMHTLMMRVHPADRLAVSRAIDRALQNAVDVQEEFRLKSSSGDYPWYAAIARPVFDERHVPKGLVGVLRNITEQRDSEMRLRRSEELLRTTTTNTEDTLWLIDTELKVRFINKSVGGRSAEDLIGAEIGELVPDGARDRVLAKLRQVLASGETATYEFEWASADHVQYLENRAVLVRDDGIGTGISISTRDITERKRLEQEILDVSGRERQSIGRDLHDGLGQELTGVALMLRGLAGRLQRQNPEAMELVNEIVGSVNQSIENARSLARGLMPVRADTGGLAFALRELASRSRDLYGLEVNFRTEAWPALTLDDTEASHLYRIAQEALTNAARHGHARTVDIELKVSCDTFLLRITDDGDGFCPPTSPYSGMGLKIMKYRAGMIGAQFEIARNEPHGTVVRVAGAQPRAASIATGDRPTRSE